jgi:uncharacterized membrane protein
MALPPIVVVVTALLWTVWYLCKVTPVCRKHCNRSKNSKTKTPKDHLTSAFKNFKITVIIVLFYMYTTITKAILAMFSCTMIEAPSTLDKPNLAYPDGLYFLEADMSIQCFAGTSLYISI